MARLVTRREALTATAAVMIAGGTVLVGMTAARVVEQRRTEDDLQSLVRRRESAPRTTLTARPGAAARTPTATPTAEPEPESVANIHAQPERGDRSPDPLPPTALVPVRLAISAIDLDAPVIPLGLVEQDGNVVWETADHAVGHHLGTANPGEPGNCVLSGHISSPQRGEGNIFHRLPYVLPGEDVAVETPGNGTWVYNVAATNVVTPEDTWAMGPTPDATLTLITCIPDGQWTHRLIVTCDAPIRA